MTNPDLLLNVIYVMFSTILPFIELRGAIPLALALGFSPMESLILTVPANSIIFIPLYFFLNSFYERYFSKIRLARAIVSRSQRMGGNYVKRYGLLGMVVLAAIPLPFFGVYSAAMVSWLLKMDWRYSSIAVAIGILLEGIVVLGLSLGIIAILPKI